MPTSKQQTFQFTEDESTFSLEDSRVKTQVMQNNTVKVNKGFKAQEQDSLFKCLEQSKKLDQSMLSPKMWLTFLKLTEGKTLEQSLVNLPDWGIMQNGEFVMLQKSVRPIKGQGCISLLTPTASDKLRARLSFDMYKRRHHRRAGTLPEQLYRLFGAVSGRVNPQLYAWMMGYPLNWLGNPYTDTETR